MIKKSFLLLIFLFISTGFTNHSSDSHFYFVQITDTHIGAADHNERLSACIDQINKLPVKILFVAHTGDIFQDNIQNPLEAQRGLELFKKIRYPVHFVPGNHDILQSDYKLTMQLYEKYFNNINSVRVYNNTVFIFFYSEPLRKQISSGDLKQFEWLQNMLENYRDKPIIIFHHAPSVLNFYKNEFHPGWPESMRNKWIDLLNKYSVKAVIAGHFHRDEFHWLGNVPLYVSSPISGSWGRQATYRIYEYNNGKIGYRTQYLQ